MGAPVGNRNAVGEQDSERPFRDAVRRAIAQDDGKRLRGAAEQLLDLAAAGESWAVKELADRMDGKPKQQTELTGANGEPFVVRLEPQDSNL
jgi:hypothetical protein